MEDPKRMVRYLQANGFLKVKGGHQKMYKPQTNRTTIVPMHGELSKAMVNEILRQAGLR